MLLDTLFVWLFLAKGIFAAPFSPELEKRATQVSLISYSYTDSTLAGSIKVNENPVLKESFWIC